MGCQPTATGWTWVVGLVALTAGGCGWVREGVLDAALRPLRESHPAGAAADRAVAAPGGATLEPADRQVLAEAQWARTLARSNSVPAFRWRHAALDDLLARPAAARPDFKRALSDANPVVAANAGIALSRLGDASGRTQLVAAVRAPQQRMALRCAAVEALGRLAGATALPLLGQLWEQYGDPQSPGVYAGELHAELVHALARHVDPAGDARLATALASPAAEARLAAVEVWKAHPAAPLPERLPPLQGDADLRVRREVLELLVARRHPAALAASVAALHDQDLQLRLKGIDALAQVGGPEARAELLKLRDHSSDLLRGSAVAGLARMGDREALDAGAKDRSWRVRAAVAEALAGMPDREGQRAAIDLLGDGSVEVQRRVVAAVQGWPLPLAGPVWLAAAERGGYLTRKTALEQLAARWPAARSLASAPAAGQKELLADMRRRFQQEFGSSISVPSAGAAPPPSSASADRLARLEALVQELQSEPQPPRRAQIVQALADWGPQLVPDLESLAAAGPRPLPESLYREVLPHSGPVFAALEGLTSADLGHRRKAAETLAELAARQPLPRLAVGRLAAVVLREADPLVWRSVLMALSGSGEPPAQALAAAGLSHPAAEVRRRACVNLELQPSREHLPALVVTLDDPSTAVVAAAARAIGACGGQEPPDALLRLLATSHEAVRVEVATAVARLGNPAGMAALERLAYSGDPAVRRHVALTMGEVGDPSFTAVLVHLLDDRSSVRRAALESLAAITGWEEPPADEASPGRHASSEADELAARWKRWFARQAGQPGRGASQEGAQTLGLPHPADGGSR